MESLPGRTAFPIRLADEIFQRCLALLPAARRGTPLVLHDPCCGSACLLSTLAYLHWPCLDQVIGSDADPAVLPLARRNLALLTTAGLVERQRTIAALLARYDKASHQEALASAEALMERLQRCRQHHDVRTHLFLADALDPAALQASLDPRAVDLVITDVPYGHRSSWLHAAEEPPIWLLLQALLPVLAPDAIVAVVSDKGQRAWHDDYKQVGKFQLGKRRVTFLAPA